MQVTRYYYHHQYRTISGTYGEVDSSSFIVGRVVRAIGYRYVYVQCFFVKRIEKLKLLTQDKARTIVQ